MKPSMKIDAKPKVVGVPIEKLHPGEFGKISNDCEFKDYLIMGMVDRVALISTGGYILKEMQQFYYEPLPDGTVVTLTF